MWLALLFLLSSLVLGAAISFSLPFKKDWLELLALSLTMGLGTTAFLTFWVSYAFSSLSWISILLVCGTALVTGFWLLKRNKQALKEWKQLRWPAITPSLTVAVLLFLLLAYFNFLAFSVNESGAISSIQNAWGDYPLHFAIINSFALRNNFPPIYPNLEGAVMRYPFLFDFLSSILVKGGLPLQASVVLPNLFMLFAVVFLARMLALKLLQKKDWAVAVALLFFFLNGNLAFLQFFGDVGKAQDVARFVQHVPEYTKNAEQGMEVLNLVYSIFIPQRTILLGFALALVAYYLLLRIMEGEAKKEEYMVLGIIVGMLPLSHVASFAVVGAASLFVFLVDAWKKKRADANWWAFGILAFVLVIPQMLWVNEQPRPSTFFAWQPGWLSKTTDLEQWALFWFNNVGIILPLAVLGLLVADNKMKLFYVPFLVVFAAANLARFQPWGWDNTKYFAHWILFTALLAGGALQYLVYKLKSRNSLRLWLGRGIVLLLVVFGVGGGVFTFWYWSGTTHELFSAEDVRMAETIAVRTPQNAVFLTAPKHNHFIYALAGRQTVLGYEGHTWSHGLDAGTQAQCVYGFFRGEKFEKCGSADYVLVSHFEEEMNRGVGDKLEGVTGLEKEFDVAENGNRYRLFKFR